MHISKHLSTFVCVLTIVVVINMYVIYSFFRHSVFGVRKKISRRPVSTQKLLPNILRDEYENSDDTVIAKQHDYLMHNAASAGAYGSCAQIVKEKFHRPKEYIYFTDDFKIDKVPLVSWIDNSTIRHFCDDQVTIYNNRFGILNNVIMFAEKREMIDAVSKGGEELRKVMNQQINKEDYVFKNDFWEIKCSNVDNLPNTTDTFKWLRHLKFTKSNITSSIITNFKNLSFKLDITDQNSKHTIAVQRLDYANLHNWVRCIFNTFLMMVHFNLQPNEISVLFLDGHPFTSLDKSWEVLYGPPVRVGQLTKDVAYKKLIWSLREDDGPITLFREARVPYIEEFRSFVLQQHGLNNVSNLDCKRIRITIILRRNAVYHPRNIEGNVGRKIFNEAELIGSLMEAFPDACVQGVLMESLPMAIQLEIISQTDVLIGMHGAGMSHTTFLPKHAAMLELFSKGFKTGRPWYECFQSIARWRGLKYDSWENLDGSIEMRHDFTILPVDELVKKTKGLVNTLCLG